MPKQTKLEGSLIPLDHADILAFRDDCEDRIGLIETAFDCEPIEGFARIDAKVGEDGVIEGLGFTLNGQDTVQL